MKNACLAITALAGALLLALMFQRVDNYGLQNLVNDGVIHGLLLLVIAVRVTLK